MNIEKLKEYTMLRREHLADISSEGYLLRHKKSGARVMVIENDDENKVFNIAFRTPPSDSTGVAHILEHSVLCGSRKFPLKDPFVELVKGSLNTFLNAMTYPDKTMYPVASCNDQDFKNLMDVYLDAVFYPNIYKKEEIFRQEGWHYELKEAGGSLSYNGVVYNEMKGAFSSPEEMMDREIFNTLFPDTAYGVESGGDPEEIPNLTYEAFLDFHRKYYHPSNSYIYLYGDVDMEERLTWLDREYLCHFDAIEVDSRIKMQTPFAGPVEKELFYPIGDNEPEASNTYLTWNAVTGDGRNVEQNTAFQILEYALLSAPGAPLKKALLDAGIGKDIIGSYEDGILQPFFSIVAKNAEPEDKERFCRVITDTLRNLAEKGINKKALEAGINYFEFRFREADYSSYPKGLMYGIDVFDSWLYDEEKPFDYLLQLEIFASLKEKIGSGYFENLLKTCLLNNPHRAVVTVKPKKGLAREKEKKLEEKLAAYKASLSEQEIWQLVKQTEDLLKYQEEEETPEALASIPMLTRGDIKKEAVKLHNEMRSLNQIPVLFHNIPTNQISYMILLFDTGKVPEHLVPYLGLLKAVLGYVDTEHYTYDELFNEINANSGGIICGMHVLSRAGKEQSCRGMFGIKAKCLYPQLSFVFRMIREILTTSRLDDEKRLYEIIARQKSRLQMSIPGSGHASAVSRLTSYYSASGCLQEEISGIGYYKFVEKLEEQFESRKEEIIENLKELMKFLFRRENFLINYTADEEGFRVLKESMPDFDSMFCQAPVEVKPFSFVPSKKNEGFKTSGQVQYVAVGGNFKADGYEYTGALQILRMILSYDYLWNNIRVKGGAYGCMSGFKRTGDAYFVSYRDPHLTQTISVYEGIPDYLRSFTADERQMTKYIIGTISGMDTPLTPQGKGMLSFHAYFSGVTEEQLQKERDEILNAQEEDIRKLADIIRAVLDQKNLCVIGSEAAIEKNEDKFLTVKHLIG
ncbi:MAG: insulinase family protein [Ruminococcus sp.]|jgi:Zn-dependent M16 (insulinase) family peptidase